MADDWQASGPGYDVAPGEGREDGPDVAHKVRSYLLGLALAVGLTIASFYVAGTSLIWGPAIPVALIVLAIAQMGVHLVFFLHISSAPDQTNNFLALAFGIFIVGLIVFGSMIIMANLNHAMVPMDQLMQMQR